MKTIITKSLDGYDIIIGFGDADAIIDPQATRRVVDKEIIKTETWKKIEQIKKQMQVYANQALQAKINCSKSKSKSDADKFYAEFLKRRNDMVELESELKPLAIQIDIEYRSMILKHAIHFTPTAGEYIVSDAEADIAIQKKDEADKIGMLLDKNLKQVADNRGIIYWQKSDKWYKSEIRKIGEVPSKNMIAESDLTGSQTLEIKDQLEKERIAAMGTASKNIELQAVISVLKQEAVNMRSVLEIEGDKAALVKVQDWLAEKTLEAEIKYE
jgi:hypothetical protein